MTLWRVKRFEVSPVQLGTHLQTTYQLSLEDTDSDNTDLAYYTQDNGAIDPADVGDFLHTAGFTPNDLE